MRRIILPILLVLVTLNFRLMGQHIGASEIDEADVSPWMLEDRAAYAGVYHFGESEAESELSIFFADDLTIGQIISGDWEEDAKSWKWKYENLSNIRIDEKGVFTSDQYSGQFVRYKDEGEMMYALRIDNPWTAILPDSKYELGIKSELNPYTEFYGTYPETSSRLLTEAELTERSKEELRIMRNEIFARYGYTFKEGGEMDQYFRKQDWYNASHTDVNPFITELELRNLALIRAAESKH